MQNAPWPTYQPKKSAIVAMGISLMGDGLRDTLDPRLSHIKK